MRKYSAAVIGLLAVGLLTACSDPNEEVSLECSVFFKDGKIVPTTTGLSAIPEARQIRILRKDNNGTCQKVRDLSDAGQLRICSPGGTLPCVEPTAQQAAANAPKGKPVDSQLFTDPPVVAGITTTLIEPTDRKERLEKIKQGESKNDPFLELEANIPPLPPPPKVNAPRPQPQPPRTQRGTITIKEPTITVPDVPPPPDPAEAKAVQISGIMQIGQELVAIASVPGDRLPTRTIRAGQRIADGKVLVKRIDNSGLSPSVILEQFGIEVKRSVGEVVAAVESSAPQLPSQPTK